MKKIFERFKSCLGLILKIALAAHKLR